jgi:F0F1-type ATP synthase alpha subunit
VKLLIGRVVNPLGIPVDGLGEIKMDKTRPVSQQHWSYAT